MTKHTRPGEWAERIRDLMDAAGLSQTVLAEKLESGESSGGAVSQGTVSSWLSGQPRYAPSGRMFAQLGNIAVEHGLDPLWFWEQAGFDRSAAISLAEQMLKKMRRKAAPGEIVEIPLLSIEQLLQGHEDETAKKRAYPLPAKLLTNPLSTVALVVGKDSTTIPFAPGDVVVVDHSATDLQSLWNKIVLVRLETPSDRRRARGLYMGVLALKEQYYQLWPHLRAELSPVGDPEGGAPLPIGHWADGEASKKFDERLAEYDRQIRLAERAEFDSIRRKTGTPEWQELSASAKVAARKAAEIAVAAKLGPRPDRDAETRRMQEAGPAKIRPDSNCRVIGRMVAWFPADAGEAKG